MAASRATPSRRFRGVVIWKFSLGRWIPVACCCKSLWPHECRGQRLFGLHPIYLYSSDFCETPKNQFWLPKSPPSSTPSSYMQPAYQAARWGGPFACSPRRDARRGFGAGSVAKPNYLDAMVEQKVRQAERTRSEGVPGELGGAKASTKLHQALGRVAVRRRRMHGLNATCPMLSPEPRSPRRPICRSPRR